LEQFASQEKNKLIPLQTKVQAHQVPDQDNYLREYSQTLDEILNANTEDRIKKIAGEGRTLDEYQQKLQKIQNALSDENLTVLKNASFTLHQLWPVLKSADRTGEELQNAVEELTQDVDLETLNDRISQLKSAAERISSEYQKLYSERHRERAESYTQAIEEINGRREITSISEDMRKSILSELERRACDELQFSEDNATCQNCGAGAAQMASDIAAVEGLKQKAVERLLELTTEDEEQQVEWVHLSDYFPNRIESVDDLEDALNQLKDELTKRLEEGQYIAIK